MRKRHVLALATAVGLVVIVTAAAATIAVTINLQGGVGARSVKACGALHHYTIYRRASRLKIDGATSPAPASYRVKLKVKQCLRGTFRTVWTGVAVERANGAFTGFYLARRRGLFFARAYVRVGQTTFKSDKAHFQVR